MPRVTWSLLNGCPRVSCTIVPLEGLQPPDFDLLADTGAGSNSSPFELILTESDCRLYGVRLGKSVALSGAFSGRYPLFELRVQIPGLAFDQLLNVVGVPAVPEGFKGTACFRFLNRLDYGNFGNPALFGLER